MNHKTLFKRCERCEKKFAIPLFRNGSKAKMFAIDFTPCPFCHFVKDVCVTNYDREGRCIGCSVPFCVVKHKAKGMCHRCLMEKYRSNSTKTSALHNI